MCRTARPSPVCPAAPAQRRDATVEVKWFRTSGDGKQEHFFTTKLEDATVVEIHTVLPHAQDSDSDNDNYTQLIKTSLAYRKVSWSHVVAGTEASDDWRKPA